MTIRRQGNFFPLPSAEATLVGPDGTTRTMDGQVRNSLTDACYVSGGANGGGYGAFTTDPGNGPIGLGYGDGRSNADVTSATSRKRPDYG